MLWSIVDFKASTVVQPTKRYEVVKHYVSIYYLIYHIFVQPDASLDIIGLKETAELIILGKLTNIFFRKMGMENVCQ